MYVTVRKEAKTEKSKMLKSLLLFHRASALAEVVCEQVVKIHMPQVWNLFVLLIFIEGTNRTNFYLFMTSFFYYNFVTGLQFLHFYPFY